MNFDHGPAIGPVTPRTGPGSGPFNKYVSNYVFPRAFPSQNPEDVERLQGLIDLQHLRLVREMNYVPEGWASEPAGPGDGGTGGGEPTVGPCNWVHIGPSNVPGRISDIAIDESDPDLMFVATVGGVWRSTNAGRRWQRVSDSFLGSKAASVAVNPADASEIWVGTGDPQYQNQGLGLWRSTQNGDPGTWTRIGPAELDTAIIGEIIVSPDGSTVYIASSTGVYEGIRSGPDVNFSRLDGFSRRSTDLEIDFSGPTLYATVIRAGADSGVWKYDGVSWLRRSAGIDGTDVQRISIGLSRSDPNVLYANIAKADNNPLWMKTTTGGEAPDGSDAWTVLPGARDDNPYAWYLNTVVHVDPTDADTVYYGGISLYRSADGGDSFTRISGGSDTEFPRTIHADQQAFAFHPSSPTTIFIGNDGGLYRAIGVDQATWHWDTLAHGMRTTEFYRMGSQHLQYTVVGGGSQDNGTEVTFGNRTWYLPGGCDGSDASFDAQNSDFLYAFCNTSPRAFTNPVPYSASGTKRVDSSWVTPSGISVRGPVLTDPTVAGVAVATGRDASSNSTLLRTADQINWTTILTPAAGATIGKCTDKFCEGKRGLAISYSANANGKKSYYVLVLDGTSSNVWASHDDGATWAAGTGLSAPGSIADIAVDPTNPQRAIAVKGGSLTSGVEITTDGGATWAPLPTAGTAYSGNLTGVVIDAVDPNIIYVAATSAVLLGSIQASEVRWTPFDAGLPNGVDVNDIFLNNESHVLTIGTFGFGAYQRDLDLGDACLQQLLVVRDTVFDDATEPSASGVADPEHPIEDSTRPGFYKPDDTRAGKVHWWESTDIRIDVPSQREFRHQITQADNYEFSACPVEVGDCYPGTMVDSAPVAGETANAYVQVTNRGLQPASNVRVIALFGDASTEVPQLPADFWTTTFADGSSQCGTLTAGTGWTLVGCAEVPVVNPDVPEVVQFPWNVPANASEHSCMLTIVDSLEDPIEAPARGERSVGSLVKQSRHVAQRNLHLIDPPAGTAPLSGPDGGTTPYSGVTSVNLRSTESTAPTRTIVVSQSRMGGGGRASFMLPAGVAATATGLPQACGAATAPTGSTRFDVVLPRGVIESSTVIGAREDLDVHSDVQVLDQSGSGFGTIANVGARSIDRTSIGLRSKVGDVISVADVSVSSNAVVTGKVTSSDSVSVASSAVVTEGVEDHVSLTPFQEVVWSVAFPALVTDVTVSSGQVRTLAPGGYDEVTVRSGGTLSLSPGTYYFDEFDFNSGGRLRLTGTGPVYLYVRDQLWDWDGIQENDAQRLFVGYLGTLSLVVEGALRGTLVAPRAEVWLDDLPPGTVHKGSVFASEVELVSGSIVQHSSFMGWAGLGACAPLTPAERQRAIALGVDPNVVYPVVGAETEFTLPIAPNGTIRLVLHYESGTGPMDSAGGFKVLSIANGVVLGGNTFVVRRR